MQQESEFLGINEGGRIELKFMMTDLPGFPISGLYRGDDVKPEDVYPQRTEEEWAQSFDGCMQHIQRNIADGWTISLVVSGSHVLVLLNELDRFRTFEVPKGVHPIDAAIHVSHGGQDKYEEHRKKHMEWVNSAEKRRIDILYHIRKLGKPIRESEIRGLFEEVTHKDFQYFESNGYLIKRRGQYNLTDEGANYVMDEVTKAGG